MIDVTGIASALTSLQAAKNIAQAMVGLRDTAALQAKTNEFQSVILDAQSALFTANEERAALVNRIGELEKEMARMKAWEAEKERYVLGTVDGGAFAYIQKPGVQPTEPPHWLCTNCFDKGQKSILQFSEQLRMPNGMRSEKARYVCHTCHGYITVDYRRKPGPSSA